MINDKDITAVPFCTSIAVTEECLESWFEHLITREFRSDVHRGLHESARESKEVVPVFYNGMGWVDFDADFAQRLADECKPDLTLPRIPTPWTSKS